MALPVLPCEVAMYEPPKESMSLPVAIGAESVADSASIVRYAYSGVGVGVGLEPAGAVGVFVAVDVLVAVGGGGVGVRVGVDDGGARVAVIVGVMV